MATFSQSTLTKIDFSCIYIDDEAALRLCRGFQLMRHLKRLDLSHNLIGNDGITAIGEWLTNNKTLTFLDLRKNMIGVSHAAQVFEGVVTRNYILLEIRLFEKPYGCRKVTCFNAFIKAMCSRNGSFQWCHAHAMIVDIVIALAPLGIPCWVLLWIVDWLPHVAQVGTDLLKIRLIERVTESMRKIRK
jgi:hypothetical protein